MPVPMSLSLDKQHQQLACVSQSQVGLYDLNLNLKTSTNCSLLSPSSCFTDTYLSVVDANGSLYLFDNQNLTPQLQSHRISNSALKSVDAVGSCVAIASSSGDVHVLDLRTHNQIAQFSKPNDIAREARFFKTNLQICCIYDTGKLLMWDLRNRQTPLWRIPAQQQGFCLGFSPNYTYLATGGKDRVVNIWDLKSSAQPKLSQSFDNAYSASKLQFASHDSVAVVGRPVSSNSLRSTISVWSFGDRRVPKYVIEPHTDAVTDLQVLKSSVYTCGRDLKIKKTDLGKEPLFVSNFGPSVFPKFDFNDLEVGIYDELVSCVYNAFVDKMDTKSACDSIADLMLRHAEFRHADMWSTLAHACELNQQQQQNRQERVQTVLKLDLKSVLLTNLNGLLNSGCDVSSACLLTVFKQIITTENIELPNINMKSILESGILALKRRSAFVSATCLAKILEYGEMNASIIACAYCTTPLTQSASFCTNCKLFRLCSYCNRVANHLCITFLSCGHVMHESCWEQWSDTACCLGCTT